VEIDLIHQDAHEIDASTSLVQGVEWWRLYGIQIKTWTIVLDLDVQAPTISGASH